MEQVYSVSHTGKKHDGRLECHSACPFPASKQKHILATSGILVWMSRPFGIYKQTTMKCACVKDIPISPHQEWSGGNESQQRQASSSFAQPCYNNKNTHCTGRTRLVSRTAWNGVYSRLGESSQGYYAIPKCGYDVSQ
jgi:hypothetical protein